MTSRSPSEELASRGIHIDLRTLQRAVATLPRVISCRKSVLSATRGGFHPTDLRGDRRQAPEIARISPASNPFRAEDA